MSVVSLGMERTRRVAHRARARQVAGAMAGQAGVWLTAAAGGAMGLVALDKAFGFGVPWWWAVAGPLLVGVLGPVAITLARRRTLLGAASEVDRRLALKDRLSSAISLAGSEASPALARGGDPFIALAIADAEEAAGKVDLRRTIPVRFRWHWGAWPVMTAMAVVGGVLLPTWNVLSDGPRKQELAQRAQEQRREAATEVRSAVELAKKSGSDVAEIASPKELAALEQLESELQSGHKDADAARQESARTLEKIASRLDDQAESARMEADATRKRLAQTAGEAGPAESSLTRAMRQGDLAAARAAAQSVMSGLGELSPQERRQLAQDLEQLSKDLAALDERAAKEKSQAAQLPRVEAEKAEDSPAGTGHIKPPDPGIARDLRRDLENQGLAPNQVSQIAAEPDPQAAEKQMQNLGVPPEAAQRLAERLQQDRAQRQAEEKAREQTDDLARSLKDAAEALREQPPSPAGEQPADSAARPPDKAAQPPVGAPRDEKTTSKPDSQKAQDKSRPNSAPDSKPQDGTTRERPQEKPGEGNAPRPTDSSSSKQGQPRDANRQPTPEQPGKPDGAGQPRPKQGDPSGAPGTPQQSPEGKGQTKTGEKQPSDNAAAPTATGDKKTQPEAGGQAGQKEAKGDKAGTTPRPVDTTSPRAPTDQLNKPQDQPGGKPSGDSKPGDAGKPGTDPGAAKPEASGTPGQPPSGETPRDVAKSPASSDPNAAKRKPGEHGNGPQKPEPGAKPGDGAEPERKGEAPQAGDQSTSDKPEQTAAGNGKKAGEHPDPKAAPSGQKSGAPKPGEQGSPEGQPPDARRSPNDQAAPTDRATSRDEQASPTGRSSAPGSHPKQPGPTPTPEGQEDSPQATPDGRAPDEKSGDATEPHDNGANPDPKSLGDLLDKLEKMDHPRDQADRDQRLSRDLRDRARQMLENATPEERERLERWAQQYAKQRGPSGQDTRQEDAAHLSGTAAGDQPGANRRGAPTDDQTPPRTDLVDARPRGDRPPGDQPTDQRVVAERYSNQKSATDPDAAVARQQVQQVLQRAKDSAQRAVDDRLVPGRYDKILKRYFDRLPAKVLPAAAPETAKDADGHK